MVRAVAAIPVLAAVLTTLAGLAFTPVRLDDLWRALALAGAPGWQILLASALLTPPAMAVGWLVLTRSLWPWTTALTGWLATLAILAGRLHHWMTVPMWAGLAGVVLASLAALAFVWTRALPGR